MQFFFGNNQMFIIRYPKKQISILWFLVFTHEIKMYRVFAIFHWVLQIPNKLTELFSYYFHVTSTILIEYSSIPLLFDTPCLKNNWVFWKNNWVKTPKSSVSVSLDIIPNKIIDVE